MTTALIVVDVQNDFCEGGSLAVDGGAAVAARISAHLSGHDYGVVVATRDYHIDPGDHFSDRPDFVDSWPPHCRVGTPGADFHPAFDTTHVEQVFSKGAYSASYSGFEGVTPVGEPLADWLRGRGVNTVVVCGIATDYCVRATALDAAAAGFATELRLDLSAAVAPANTGRVLQELRAAGVEVSGEQRDRSQGPRAGAGNR